VWHEKWTKGENYDIVKASHDMPCPRHRLGLVLFECSTGKKYKKIQIIYMGGVWLKQIEEKRKKNWL